MLTKDDIRRNLKEDPYWTPDDDASNEVWDWFDEVYDELYGGGSEDDVEDDMDFDSPAGSDDEE